MKKILGTLIATIVLVMLWNSPNTQASCYGVWSIEQEASNTTTELKVQSDTNFETIEPMCAGGTPPVGWSSVRSKAVLNNTTSTGKKIYHNNTGGAKTASTDFGKIASGSTTTKYINSDGSVTFVKRPVQGDVRFYRSSSGDDPTIWWGNEKIRYLGSN